MRNVMFMHRGLRSSSAGLLVSFALLLSACAATTSQLSDFKKAEGAKNFAAIESQSIEASCGGNAKNSAECAQLAEIQGRACDTLVRQESAPNAACPPATDSARRRLQCVVDDFDAARLGHEFPPDQLNELREMHARALYCSATLMTRAAGLADAREAFQELDKLPADPRRDQLAAATQLYVANSEQLSNTERCSAAQRAVQRADRGLQNGPPDDLKQGLMSTRDHAAGVAAHLTNCQVP